MNIQYIIYCTKFVISHRLCGAIGQRVRLLIERLVVRAHPGTFLFIFQSGKTCTLTSSHRPREFQVASKHKVIQKHAFTQQDINLASNHLKSRQITFVSMLLERFKLNPARYIMTIFGKWQYKWLIDFSWTKFFYKIQI